MKKVKSWIKKNKKEITELITIAVLTGVVVIIAKDLSTPDIQAHRSGKVVRTRKNRFYNWRYFAVSQ